MKGKDGTYPSERTVCSTLMFLALLQLLLAKNKSAEFQAYLWLCPQRNLELVLLSPPHLTGPSSCLQTCICGPEQEMGSPSGYCGGTFHRRGGCELIKHPCAVSESGMPLCVHVFACMCVFRPETILIKACCQGWLLACIWGLDC